MNPENIQKQIEDGLPNASVRVESNDNIHFVATIISDKFIGLSRLAQHRLIYSILAEDLRENIHALQLITKTPEENK